MRPSDGVSASAFNWVATLRIGVNDLRYCLAARDAPRSTLPPTILPSVLLARPEPTGEEVRIVKVRRLSFDADIQLRRSFPHLWNIRLFMLPLENLL